MNDIRVPDDFPPVRDRLRYRLVEWRDSVQEWWRWHPNKAYFVGFMVSCVALLLIIVLAIFGVIGRSQGGNSQDFQIGNGP
jgi:hypothetical protein